MSEQVDIETNVEDVASPLNMSDEDFLNSDLPEYDEEVSEASAPAEESEETDEEDSGREIEEVEEVLEEETTEEGVDTDTEETVEEVTEEVEPEEETTEESEIDYKAAYEEITKPFKANGKEIKVDNIEEAITLMKMGANYNKKMVAIKDNLKYLKMLENHNLLDQDKLSYLIDLDKKDPNAINKLIKDSGIDPLEVDVDNEVDYTPKSYSVSDSQIELDSVLEELRGSEGYSKTIDIIGNQWDAQSRDVFRNEPNLIKAINSHVEAGIYDQVITQVEKRRMFGELQGLSDLEAYKLVGDEMFVNSEANQQPVKPVVKKPVVPKQTKVDPTVKSKKLAASPTKSGKQVKSEADVVNPLSMSDEDFEKFMAGKY